MARTGRGAFRRRISELATKANARGALGVASAILIAAGAAAPALAQGWWPFGGDEEPPRQQAPVPSESIYDDPYGERSQPRRPNSICLELEQRLVQEGQRGGEARNLIPRIENDLRQAQQAYRSQKQQLDRGDCYEYFLFSKTLKRTRRCVDLANQADNSRRRIDDLEVQLSQIQGSSGRNYRDEIIRELARNNCGATYQQQARRQEGGFSGFWDDGESSGYSGGGSRFGALPYATYRTVCVRLCDGYYFPVSFSTLPNHFQRDEDVCQSKCAAPAALYYHQNPGAGMEQAVAARDNSPYKQLKTAFRYRKEYVNGCSCKVAEYQPEPGAVVHQSGGGQQGGAWTSGAPAGATGGEAQPPPAAPPAQESYDDGGGYDAGGAGEALPWETSPQ